MDGEGAVGGADGEVGGGDGVGRGGGVGGHGLVAGEQPGGDISEDPLGKSQGAVDGLGVMAVGDGERDARAVLGKARGGAELRDGPAGAVLHAEIGRVDVGGEGVVADVLPVEAVDVVGRGELGVGSAGLDEALQDVDGLGDVGHGDAIGAGGEDV